MGRFRVAIMEGEIPINRLPQQMETIMNFKRLLLTAAAAAVLSMAGASTASAARLIIGPHGGVSLHVGGHHDHDRYWRDEYRDRGYIDRDHVFMTLRTEHYSEFDGDPFWRDGRYVVWAHRHHRRMLVEVNPYTGGFIGEVHF